ncbi:hypothetical protein BJ508DRAFT_308518 [Ascobolus immersus RN42]|uniref:Uncharacterized protein n=1 Tax=Ascobolus immersus RN42 TaxID=1160509 RepID=A0A3N4HZY2_ASCIM|nr:hypothetical protein BJ508DRAFT_308518 [Ascobolus immersus RN42]
MATDQINDRYSEFPQGFIAFLVDRKANPYTFSSACSKFGPNWELPVEREEHVMQAYTSPNQKFDPMRQGSGFVQGRRSIAVRSKLHNDNLLEHEALYSNKQHLPSRFLGGTDFTMQLGRQSNALQPPALGVLKGKDVHVPRCVGVGYGIRSACRVSCAANFINERAQQ